MINFLKQSLQSELDSFFQTLKNSLTPIRSVTKGAFTRARSKFNYEAFIELNQSLIDYTDKHAPLRTWHGFRLLAVDGTTIQVPTNPKTSKFFDDKSDLIQPCRPMARASQLYDLLNQLTLDATIRPYREGERELALEHGPSLLQNDLVLLDRGYPAFWFYAWLLSENVHFCARVSLGSWHQVTAFYASGKSEQLITIYPTTHSRKKCREYNLPTKAIQIRLVRVSLPDAEDHILMTSLLDAQAVPFSYFQDLYHQRWSIEENYKQMKSRIEIENFSGKSVESVYQDFHAKIFAMNLAAAFDHAIKDTVEQDSKEKKHSYQVNRAFVLSTLKNNLVRVFLQTRPHRLLKHLLTLFRQTTEPIRPGRSFARKKVMRDRPTFYLCYKPTT